MIGAAGRRWPAGRSVFFVSGNKLIALVLIGVALAGAAPYGCAQGPTVQTFVLKDDLGQTWSHDLVFFALDKPLSAAGQAGVMLLGPDGTAVPCQFSTEGPVTKIAFLADLPAFGQATYRLMPRSSEIYKNTASPFQIERKADSLSVSNGVTGVEVPTATGHYQDGPILGLRMKSGAWIGGSRLTTKQTIAAYDATVTASGPVFVDLTCSYSFAGGKSWVMKLRLIAGEPVVLLRETFDLGDDSHWEFLAGPHFSPNYALMRPGGSGPYTMFPLKFDGGASQVQLCPWDTWWDNRDALFFGLFHAEAGVTYAREEKAHALVRTGPPAAAGQDDDMLIAAAGDVAAWARSGPEVYDYAPGKFVPLKTQADGEVAFQLQLAAPGRSWLLAAGSVAQSLVTDPDVAPAQKLMNRYCETPLDDVKDMTLHWQHTATYPRLYLKADDIKRLVASPDLDKLLARNPTWSTVKQVLFPAIAGQGPVSAAAGAPIKQDLLAKVQGMVSYFTYGNKGLPAAMFGTFIPRLEVGQVLPSLDLALGAGLFTPEEKERIFAQLAFVADKIVSPDYVSPGRSLGGNPNMVTNWAAALVLMACMLPDHPHAQAWYQEGMGRLSNMLDTWQGPNGGWLEAPHYQMAALDSVFLAEAAAANSGFLGKPFDERLLRTVLFLAKICTPPDPRFGNLRHYPPLGNTYQMETTEMFGAMAKLCRAQEPDKAAALQWMWLQEGKPHWIGLGGDAMLDFYREFLADEDWSPPAPPWTSELFPGFGAVLRSGFPGDHESYLVYHQGPVSTAHYDDDQGSFELWGHGRPLCLDWGYHGYAPAWEHNRLGAGGIGKVLEFSTQPAADYVHGQQNDKSWDRQILFVKDADPLGPNYFLFRDSTTGTGTLDWHLWIDTGKGAGPAPAPSAVGQGPAWQAPGVNAAPDVLQIAAPMVHAVSENDADLDVWFAPPADGRLGQLQTQLLTVATVKGFVGGGWSGWDEGKLTQIGLQLAQPRGEPLVTLLYPRRPDEQPPVLTALAGGQGVKVVSAAGVDYAFLGLTPFTFTEGPVSFSGTAGVIQVRGTRVTCSLNAAGQIGYGKAQLTATAPDSKTFQQ
jgi:hypothetical protein